MAMARKAESLSNEDIIRLCNRQGDGYGRFLKCVDNGIFVKFGCGVTEDEYHNQLYAFRISRLSNGNIRVPEVYRFFEESGMRYLVMELVQGNTLDKISPEEYPTILPRLAEGMLAFSTTLPPDFPGPRGHGHPRGYLFSEDGAGEPLDTMEHLNSWLNGRALGKTKKPFNFQLSDCIFCHMDLRRQNIIVRKDIFYILDWEYSGYYPPALEKYSILFIGEKEDYQYANMLSTDLDIKSGYQEDIDTIQALNTVYRNNSNYSFSRPLTGWDHIEHLLDAMPS